MDDTKEDLRSYWNLQPCNSNHSKQPRYSYEYSREVRARKYTVEPHIPDFADHVSWHRKKVLDLGCGIGTDTLEFARFGAAVTAVDFSVRSLDILTKRAHAESLDSGIRIRLDDIETLDRLGTERQVYDLIYSFGVLHHTPNPVAALCKAWELAKSGAELRIMVYHRYSFKALWILAIYGKFQFWKWAELRQKYSEAQTGSPLTRTYTRKSATFLVEAAGWKVYKTEVAHIFPYQIKHYKRGHLVEEWYWRFLPRKLLERFFGWHLLVWARKV